MEIKFVLCKKMSRVLTNTRYILGPKLMFFTKRMSRGVLFEGFFPLV